MAHQESDLEKKWAVKKWSFLDKEPVEFELLSKIHANDRNGPSSTILKWMLDMQQLPVTISKNGLTVLLYYSTESQV